MMTPITQLPSLPLQFMTIQTLPILYYLDALFPDDSSSFLEGVDQLRSEVDGKYYVILPNSKVDRNRVEFPSI